MHNIAIFASGAGSNAQKIMEYFKNHPKVRVGLVVSNKANAGVLAISESFGIPIKVVDRKSFYESEVYVDLLEEHKIEWIILAGFLWLVPDNLLERFPGRIINIHPALLPSFGGKGMYGLHVHEAVKASGVSVTGITIHKIDAEYDRGETLFQAKVAIAPTDTAKEIAANVLALEHRFFPEVIERTVLADKV